MSSISDNKPAKLSLRADSEILLAEYCKFLRNAGIRSVTAYKGFVDHFLIWLQLSNIVFQAIDYAVVNRFLQHTCGCCDAVPTVKLPAWCKRGARSPLMWFVNFMEQSGRIKTLGELETNMNVAEDFLSRLNGAGYAQSAFDLYRCAVNRLISWLHVRRIRLCDLTPQLLEEFWNNKLVYSVPGIYSGHRSSPTQYRYYRCCIDRFLDFLVETGRIKAFQSASNEASMPRVVEKFCVWLRRNRDVNGETIRVYSRGIVQILTVLGENPEAYDVHLIRAAFWKQIENRSSGHAKEVATLMRMYLRFLVSEGCVAASLIEAIPTVPQWRLSTLPRYISDEDVERTIKCCNGPHSGVRDTAILLLLARLALRAGDIVALRFCDIDWNRAEIRVSGKSRCHVVLPLPQDVGDALYAYIATARPKSDEQQIFLGSRAPHQPFAISNVVSSIVRRAFDRAKVHTPNGRGAHVLRHSKATSLLRCGASLNVIQSLLRHESPDTTMIYAKTDVTMLQEVAQPWAGGDEQ